MKKNLLVFLFSMVVLSITQFKGSAQTTLIQYWNFNSSNLGGSLGGIDNGPGPINADYTIAGTGTGYLVYKAVTGVMADTGSIDDLAGDTINQRPGFGNCCADSNFAVRTRNPSDSMEFLWYIPTTNFMNIVIKYETESSSTKSGQGTQVYSYSIDGGANFITTGLPIATTAAPLTWGLVTLDLSSITSVNNNSNFILKITYTAVNTGTKGNNRFDNITVEGEPINTNGIEKIATDNGYSIYPNPVADNLNINSTSSGNKTVIIYNSIGQEVTALPFTGKNLFLNTSSLSSGIYCISIINNNGDKNYTMKFVKN